MLSLGPLAFASPWLLAALATLPILWWLLRVTPPAPKRLSFPAIRLLLGLQPPEETPSHTPLWLILLRVTIAALVILGLAKPILNPSAELAGDGPVLMVVDDGWAAAPQWPARVTLLESLLDQAERGERPVALIASAPDERGGEEAAVSFTTAAQARDLLQSLAPKPWPVDRASLAQSLAGFEPPEGLRVVWLTDGLDTPGAEALAERLSALGTLQVFRDADTDLARVVRPPETDGLSLRLKVERPVAGQEAVTRLTASDDEGRLVAETQMTFEAGATVAEAGLTLPVELRNRITRLSIREEASAGALLLLDERWRRRPVGLVSGGPLEGVQPLLSDLYYLERALEPFTEIRRGAVEELLQQDDIAVMVLSDVGALLPEQSEPLKAWVANGGLLLRFAGPRLADAEDELLPVTLRRGGRTLGGALTWDDPARLAPFPAAGPLAGVELPDDVIIERQVLAEPSLDLAEKTWARLSDGTPLITAEQRDFGWIVLVHTTANTEWSNLSLSGLFVEILRRIVEVSQGVSSTSDEETALPPLQTLDGFGRLGRPPAAAISIAPAELAAGRVGPSHPPGIYGTAESRRALNLAAGLETLAPLPSLPNSALYAGSEEIRLMPWLLAAALVLGLADTLIGLAMRGLLSGPRRAGKSLASGLTSGLTSGLAVLGLLGALAMTPGEAGAQSDTRADQPSEAELAAALETRLAYVITGVPAVDEISHAGLEGLSRVLARRTAVEPGAPAGVRLGRDELSFYPLLYWAITPEQRDLDSLAARALRDYLANGGTVLIDLREANTARNVFGQGSRNSQALRRLTRELEVPGLSPIPPEHVLTKAFYLLQDFPGRYDGGTLWVERTEENDNDGVASVIIGSNDWAAAWAVNDQGRPMLPVVPGGERQRETAYRFGVNLVMYALTGNYKADQVHVPFILERLGQ